MAPNASENTKPRKEGRKEKGSPLSKREEERDFLFTIFERRIRNFKMIFNLKSKIPFSHF